MAKVLIIDDDELICEMLSLMVEDMGHSPSYRLTIEEGFKRSSEPFDVVFLDIRCRTGTGSICSENPRAAVPARSDHQTGLGDPDGAEIAIKTGRGTTSKNPHLPRRWPSLLRVPYSTGRRRRPRNP